MSNALQLYVIKETNQQQDEIEVLTDEFCQECGFSRLPWMKREFAQLVAQGFEHDLICEIISRTARAPRPSWAYLSSIVQRCRGNGVYSLADFVMMKNPYRKSSELPY